MSIIYSDSFHGGKGHADGDDIPLALAFQDVADDVAAIVARSDAAMQAKVDALATQLTAVRTAQDVFVGNFNGHRGAAGVHKEADSVNEITSPVATDLLADGIASVNHAVDQFETHRVNIAGGIHGAATDPNEVTAAVATDKATAIARGADLYDQYEAHRVYVTDSVHGGADNTNTIAATKPTDWDELILFLIEFKDDTAFNQHIALTAGPVHGADGSVDAITADDPGVQIAAVYVELIELKDDYSLHTVSLGLHPNPGTVESTADATTEATAFALANALKATLNANFADADVHMDADTLSVDATDATGYEDLLPITAEIRADFIAHMAKTTVHSKADAANAASAMGAGGDVAVLGTGGAVTLKTINGGTR